MNYARPTILFVEDHADTLELFALVLSRQNYEVVTASTFEDAFAKAKSRQFDLLVLDAQLSDGSGVELCRNIRETDQRTPILFCSGLAFEKDRQEALHAGAQGYLVKPVGIDRMCETVEKLISAAGRRTLKLAGEMPRDRGVIATHPSR